MLMIYDDDDDDESQATDEPFGLLGGSRALNGPIGAIAVSSAATVGVAE